MASILDRYGIKEVADVTFYNINNDGTRGNPVLYLDTLKVSTIEQTAETSDARGGKGNPKLVTWDYGKDITVTLEDALFSAKSLAIMFGNGTVAYNGSGKVTRTVMVKLSKAGELPLYFTADILKNGTSVRTKVYPGESLPSGVSDGVLMSKTGINIKTIVSETGKVLSTGTWSLSETTGADLELGDKVFVTYEISAAKKEIVISGDSFPGTYYVTGDTYARSDVTGADQFFQFVIPKAKVTSENTITLEAEGDPSVFNMNLTVLRPEDGEMMRLVQYDLITDAGATA
jgi:hypothetical protein